jgi:lysophospholipase L1-like esterase
MLWPTTGGTQVKVKLTNLFTSFAVDVGAAHIALRSGTGANIASGSDRTLTFAGLSAITLAPNSEIWSDPVALTVTSHSDIAVSIYLPGHSTPTTMMARGGLKTSYYKSGNQVSALTMTGASTTTKDVFVSEVQVLSPASAIEIAIDGDSIVEGACSDSNANGDWPDLLSNRLPFLPSGAEVGIANAGVGSGRFVSACSPPNVNCAGPSGLSRLPSLLALPGIRFVIVSMGINDISYNAISASELISAYQSAISQAHSAGVKIFGVPLLPIKHSVKDTLYNETTRTTVNTWIRGGTTGYDGVIDFEPIVSDPNDPDSFKSNLTCDHVHPNQAGYTLMASSIDLSLFQ